MAIGDRRRYRRRSADCHRHRCRHRDRIRRRAGDGHRSSR